MTRIRNLVLPSIFGRQSTATWLFLRRLHLTGNGPAFNRPQHHFVDKPSDWRQVGQSAFEGNWGRQRPPSSFYFIDSIRQLVCWPNVSCSFLFRPQSSKKIVAQIDYRSAVTSSAYSTAISGSSILNGFRCSHVCIGRAGELFVNLSDIPPPLLFPPGGYFKHLLLRETYVSTRARARSLCVFGVWQRARLLFFGRRGAGQLWE